MRSCARRVRSFAAPASAVAVAAGDIPRGKLTYSFPHELPACGRARFSSPVNNVIFDLRSTRAVRARSDRRCDRDSYLHLFTLTRTATWNRTESRQSTRNALDSTPALCRRFRLQQPRVSFQPKSQLNHNNLLNTVCSFVRTRNVQVSR